MTEMTVHEQSAILENVVINGDLAQLSPQDRVQYYRKVCDSLGVNPLTQPFAYIKLNGKLTLYAKRDAADQLRKIHGISIGKPAIEFEDDLVIVTVIGTDKTGRTDSDLGVVNIGGLRGEAKANAILKAITKAKRRLTLSIVGLGWLDETEVETIPGAEIVNDEPPVPQPAEPRSHWINDPKVRARFWAWTGNDLGLTDDQVHAALNVKHISDYAGTAKDAKADIEAWVAQQGALLEPLPM